MSFALTAVGEHGIDVFAEHGPATVSPASAQIDFTKLKTVLVATACPGGLLNGDGMKECSK